MTRGALPLLLLSLLGPACAGDPAGSGAECSCVAVLRLDGRLYAIADPSLLGGDPGEIVAHVARHVPCDDTPGP
ncbi:MAG TPA: hypothetical protein VLL48_12935, partial [Longimicrobiales bacterium]|nr:hypothetical protein [Longimicrobiales bacterium]